MNKRLRQSVFEDVYLYDLELAALVFYWCTIIIQCNLYFQLFTPKIENYTYMT